MKSEKKQLWVSIAFDAALSVGSSLKVNPNALARFWKGSAMAPEPINVRFFLVSAPFHAPSLFKPKGQERVGADAIYDHG